MNYQSKDTVFRSCFICQSQSTTLSFSLDLCSSKTEMSLVIYVGLSGIVSYGLSLELVLDDFDGNSVATTLSLRDK